MFREVFLLTVAIATVDCLNRTRDQDNAALELFNNCKCVVYYLCDKDNYIITSGETIIGIRLQDLPDRKICQGGTYVGEIVCCKERNPTTDKIDPTTPVVVVAETTTPEQRVAVTRPSKKKKLKCGQQLPNFNVRILSEEVSVPVDGEFPWIVALFLRRNAGGHDFHCSGSLIHPGVILTAAHCVYRKNPGDFVVLVNGKIELNPIGTDVTLERNVLEILSHPDYYAGAVFNDIALLFLDQPYNISARIANINTICLSKSETLEGRRCIVVGWGKAITPKEPKILKKVTVPPVEFYQCQEQLRKTRLGVRFQLHESFMCAGGEKDKDACRGDGGSPLMCPLGASQTYFQAGIVSWGIGCGTENVPGVYANVPKFYDWIAEQLTQKEISLTP